jgi:hypothetical protein
MAWPHECEIRLKGGDVGCNKADLADWLAILMSGDDQHSSAIRSRIEGWSLKPRCEM